MPLACRIGHADRTHCSTPYRAEGVWTVVMESGGSDNGIPWSCLGHFNTTHKALILDCGLHSQPIGKASPTVVVGGRLAGCVGSDITSCTEVAQGFTRLHVPL